jgi:1-acyl-sn-glycerol-3-phosphate acyltransferase
MSPPTASERRRNGHLPAGPQPPSRGAPRSARERLARALSAGARGALSAGARRLSPAIDLDQRDPDFIRERLPLLWLLSSLWFRAEVRGLGNVPDSGAVLLVGNRSGGNLAPDTLVFTLAFNTYFGVERPFYQLAPAFMLAPPWARTLRRFGMVAETHENARQALAAGAAVLVHPGGSEESHRPSWQQGRIDFGGRMAFIRLALEQDVPIVPVVSIGGQETALFLGRGQRLARLLALDRLAHVRSLPLSLAFPWGLSVGDLLGHLPLPAKITVETLPPIDVREQFAAGGSPPDLEEVYDQVLRTMQDAMDALASERRLPLIG